MNRRIVESVILLVALLPCAGCFSPRSGPRLVVVRRPWQMIEPVPKHAVAVEPSRPRELRADDEDAGAAGKVPQRPLTRTDPPDPPTTTAEVIEEARRDATQHPTTTAFVDAVQVYDYEPGSVYEVITTPGFVTVLRLRIGEEILHLAAGDTSRWLIDTITSGVADPQAALADTVLVEPRSPQTTRASILVKPRRPLIQTNLVIATNERTYLIDLNSVETTAYHSVVEWTYPKVPTTTLSVGRAKNAVRGDDGTRNYTYLIKVPRGMKPRWTPVSVFDDGHRVHVRFPKGIDDLRRPPLFIVGRDGTVRLVNYRVDDQSYIVDELFERAELRMGHQRVVIDRIRPRSNHPIARLFRALTGTE